MQLLILAVGFGLVTASILAMAALGFNLTLAVSNVLNVGFVVFMTVGQFVGLWVTNISHVLLIGIVAGAGASGVLGVVLYFLVLPFQRRNSPPFVIVLVTFAFAVIVDNAITGIIGAQEYSFPLSMAMRRGIHPFGFLLTVSDAITILAAAALIIVVDALLRFTKLGREVRAIADDPLLARGHEVKVARVSTIVWAISGVFGGVAGIMLAITQVSFSSTTTQSYFVLLVAAALLGGAGKPYGAVAGALVIGVAVQVAAIWINPELTPLIGFCALVAVIIFRPAGMLGTSRIALRA